jgi:hypothetical protein
MRVILLTNMTKMDRYRQLIHADRPQDDPTQSKAS